MNFSDEFGGKYWKAADLDKPRLLTIERFEKEPMMGNASDLKWVVYFQEDRRGLVLNQTNAETLRSLHGDDSEQSIGKKIVLYKTSTEMQGRTVDCVRLRAPKTQTQDEQEIPF